MPYNDPVSILIVNESAEEIKLATLSFRGFFPNCRIEAVYSLEEAFQWAHRVSWHLILVDDRLHAQRAEPVIPDLKRFAPYATLVLQTERPDTPAALTALQDGADFLLYKKSPAFLTELMLYAKGLFDIHADRMMLERTQERHTRLTELLPDLLYELDSAGRFVCLSRGITDLLGYAQDELIGAPYFLIVHPDQRDHARHYFNDRRTGSRATNGRELTLIGKPSQDGSLPVPFHVRVSAKGLYDSDRRYFGTLGMIRIIEGDANRELPVHLSSSFSQRGRHLPSVVSRVSALSQRLHALCVDIQSQSQALLKVLHDTQSAEQMETLASCAAHATQLGDELLQAMRPPTHSEHAINLLIETILSDGQLLPSGSGDHIERIYASSLPPFTGSVEGLTRVIRILVSHAQRYIATMGGRRRLRISTALRAQHDTASLESPHVAIPLPELEIRMHEVDSAVMIEWVPVQAAGDLLEAHVGVKELGGRLEFLHSVGGRLSIALWVPVQSHLGFNPNSSPLSHSHDLVDAHPRGLIKNMVHETGRIGELYIQHPTDHAHMLPDRRTAVRRAVNLPIRLTIGNSVRQGVMTDLNALGASLEVEGVCTPLERQTAHLIFQTEAGNYEIHATVHHSSPWLQRNDIRSHATRVAVQFSPLNDSQRKVLASYIDEACARASTITVEVILPPVSTTEERNVTLGSRGTRSIDHRETMRVHVSLQVRIELPTRPDAREWPMGIVTNFSRGGACIHTDASIDTTEQIVALHFSSSGVDNQPRVHEPEVPEAILIGYIVHHDTDCGMSEEGQSGRSQRGTRLGIRFVRLVPFSEREINRVMAQHLDVSTNRFLYGENTSIISTRRECRNARHQVIVGADDHVRDQISPSTPILLIVPGFGLTKSDYLPLSYHLAANRFRTLRYDHTNHVGQSDGNIAQLTLRGMQTDLQNVLAFVHATWPTAPIAILAEDLAARVAIKVLARHTAAARLFLLNPVLDIETALSTSFPHEVIDGHRNASPRRGANLWGLNVNVDQFIADAIAGGYIDKASSAADIARLATPPVMFTSPRFNRSLEHMFGSQSQSLRAMGSTPVVIPLQIDISGESGAWDERHLAAFRTICKVLSAPTRDNQPALRVRSLQMRDVHQQRRLEQERIRIRHHVSQATREALSVAYLAQLSQFEQLPNYRILINELHQRLLPLDPGGTVLDIGCGMGDFAQAMLTNSIYRMSHQGGAPVVPLRYIGLDVSHETLKLAQQRVQTFGHELLHTVKTAIPISQFLETYWVQTNRTAALPIIDGSIDRVLCQLALPFTVSPLDCLRQSLRVLHPDGTAIVTCFQPQTDLSILFRQHYRATGVDESSPEAQIVLHFLGRVREAIRQGILHHYERNEFASLLSHAGARVIQIYPALENQLLLAIVGKGKSTG